MSSTTARENNKQAIGKEKFCFPAKFHKFSLSLSFPLSLSLSFPLSVLPPPAPLARNTRPRYAINNARLTNNFKQYFQKEEYFREEEETERPRQILKIVLRKSIEKVKINCLSIGAQTIPAQISKFDPCYRCRTRIARSSGDAFPSSSSSSCCLGEQRGRPTD